MNKMSALIYNVKGVKENLDWDEEKLLKLLGKTP
jgi:hypothetical protein